MGYTIEKIKNHVLENGAEYCTADWGARQPDYPGHHGIDLISLNGLSSVTAIADGEIVYVQSHVTGHDAEVYTAGNFVKLRHENGLYTRYLHLAPDSVCVKKGDKVKAGDKLGIMGDTGYSFGVHLHFDVSDGATYHDPLPYLLGDKSFYITEQEESEPGEPREGDGVRLKNAPLYISATAKHKSSTVSGAYYIYCDGVINNRIRITTPKGCKDCTGWVNVADCKGADSKPKEKPVTEAARIKAGDKVKVKTGAFFADGSKPFAYVYDTVYEVYQLSKDGTQALIGIGGEYTGWVKCYDLKIVAE